MPLTKPQQQIVEAPQRFKVVCSGRRFGKTTVAIRQLCYYGRIPNKEIFYVAPTYKQAKMIAFKKLKEKLLDLRWVKKINETELSFVLKNGTTISLKGADNFDSLRGIGLDYLVIDEAADLSSEAWYEVLRPALSDKQGQALFLGTPRGFNWFKDLFDLAEQYPDEWASFQFTTIEGGQVPQTEIDAARRTLDARVFRQEYEASFENYEGRVFYAFDRKQNIKAFDIKDYHSVRILDTLYIGMDFNVMNLIAVIAVRSENILHIIDEIHLTSSNTDEMVEEIKSRYANKSITVFPDPAGAARKTSAAGKTDHTILRAAGFTVRTLHSHNPIKDGVNCVNSKLCNSVGERTLFVDPRCKKTIESLEKLCYQEGTNQINKNSGYDHAGDALRYLVEQLFPIRQKPAPLPIQTWGVKVKKWS